MVVNNTNYKSQRWYSVPKPVNEDEFPFLAYSKTKPLTKGRILKLALICIFLYPLGSLGVGLYGLIRFFDKTEKVEWNTYEPRCRPLSRFSICNKIFGYRKESKRIAGSPISIKANRQTGIFAMSFGFGTLICFSLIVLFG